MRKMLLVLVLLVSPVFAQETAPVLSEAHAKDLEIALLDAQLKAAEAREAQVRFEALLQSLQKPGFQLNRANDRKWSYVPVPKEK